MTEKKLLNGITRTTEGGSFCSTIDGVDYIFEYRNRQSDCNPACEPFEANNITYFSFDVDDGATYSIDGDLLPNDNELVIKAQLLYIWHYDNVRAWKKLREIYNLTQKQLSEATGIPRRTIEDWESDKRKAPEYIFELARFKIANSK